MENLTAERIAAMCDHLDDRENIIAINRLFRKQDQSNLYPVLGEFNATERAIRQAQRWQRKAGIAIYGLEYALFIENALSKIVNQY